MHLLTCVGGGTGLFTLLSGLKEACPAAHLSAVVSMADSGGSTGRLRDEFGHLPPGDIRQCLVALSHAPMRLRKLMEYRFDRGELSGHSFGNLWITVLKEIIDGTREEKEYEAVKVMEEILHIKDNVYPVTLTDCHLHAELTDGTIVEGETNIDVPDGKRAPIKRVWLDPDAELFLPVRKAILRSQAVVIGPGDLYTSILPNLVVDGMADVLREAQKRGTKLVYVVNTMTKHGETDGYTASDFVQRVEDTIGARIDTIIVNTGGLTAEQRKAYEKEDAEPVEDDLPEQGVVRADLVSRKEFARHDKGKLGRIVCEVTGCAE